MKLVVFLDLGGTHNMKGYITRKFIDKHVYNEEFKKCFDDKEWSNRLAIMVDQLIDNIMSSNQFRFNKGYSKIVYTTVKSKVLEKLLKQLMYKFKYEKGNDPFSFTGSMIRWWTYKYVLHEAKTGYSSDRYKIYYDVKLKSWEKVKFVSAF